VREQGPKIKLERYVQTVWESELQLRAKMQKSEIEYIHPAPLGQCREPISAPHGLERPEGRGRDPILRKLGGHPDPIAAISSRYTTTSPPDLDNSIPNLLSSSPHVTFNSSHNSLDHVAFPSEDGFRHNCFFPAEQALQGKTVGTDCESLPLHLSRIEASYHSFAFVQYGMC
jgi:hypothetical protein